jgi:hypothetical protein
MRSMLPSIRFAKSKPPPGDEGRRRARRRS